MATKLVAEMPQNSESEPSEASVLRSGVEKVVADIAAQGWMQNKSSAETRTVSANELTSLSALIAYVAHESGDNEFRVERRLADHFNVANVTCLPADQYDNAIRYLVDGI